MGSALSDPVAANPPPNPSRLANRSPASRAAGSGGGSYGGGSGASGGFASAPTAPPTTVADGKKIQVKARSLSVKHDVETLQREWRTPPLWGVADSSPYLHDGRAKTLIEAIAYHGGEASASTGNYFELPPNDRFAIIEFLNTLQAPVDN